MSKLPEFQFFGPSENVEKFRNGLSENLANWDAERDIIQNIKSLLGEFFNCFYVLRRRYQSISTIFPDYSIILK